jgi:uncharacterized LabA/DUF88 family protein
MERVIVYIDGFNLYFGILEKGWRRYLWLDLVALSKRLLTKNQTLITTKYFTARVRADAQKIARQSTFLQAISTRGGVDIFFGRYQKKSKQCRNCHVKWNEYEEKMSDVRLATELLRDAYTDQFDTALIISADADLLPPIEVIKQDFPDKRIVICFPPKRDNPRLSSVVHGTLRIGRGRLSNCQLPKSIKKPDGYVLRRPKDWT